MTILKIKNSYGAPVYHKKTVISTMDVSRQLAEKGEPHGAVIAADFQKKGRGRTRGRSWQMERKRSLAFTILLRFDSIEKLPAALSLRAGLAVSLAIEDMVLSLKNKVMIKWPNDIIIDSKKTAGILCEADGAAVFIGIGVNLSQKSFSAPLQGKAGSISLAANINIENDKRFILMEKIISQLYKELETPQGENWKPRIEERLYKKNENAVFIEGEAGSGKKVKGRLCGISEGGELLIIPCGETKARAFVTGELTFTD